MSWCNELFNTMSISEILSMIEFGIIESSQDLITARNNILNRVVIDGVNLEDGWEMEQFQTLGKRINHSHPENNQCTASTSSVFNQPSTSYNCSHEILENNPMENTQFLKFYNNDSYNNVQEGNGNEHNSILNENNDFEPLDDRNSATIKKFKYLTKYNETEQVIKKFGLAARRLYFSFKTHEESSPLQWLKNAFDELMMYITRGFEVTDQIGITLENEDIPDKPVYVSFRKLGQLKAEVIMDIIAKVLQSNQTFFTNGQLTLKVDCVRQPRGSGYSLMNGKCANFNDYTLAKRSIFDVKNFGKNCLAIALLIALAYCNSNCNRKRLSKFKTKRGIVALHMQAEELCANAGVDLTKDGGGYDQINLFQEYLNEYTIVVYSSRDGKQKYFEGPRDPSRQCLNLIFENNHFNVILSLTGAFATRYFCEFCSVKYSNSNRHRNCPYICSLCHEKPPCKAQQNKISCTNCNRCFMDENCYNNHKKSKLCEKLKRCPTCFDNIWLNKKNKTAHVCGVKYCNICKTKKPKQHFCYMQPNKVKEDKPTNKNKTNFLFIFYDFETTQDKIISENLFLHEPNLCVAQQTCLECITNDDVSIKCSNCGVREHVFTEDPVNDLLNYIVSCTLKKKKNKFSVTAISHNMKGFDGCFILQSLFKDINRWNPEVIRTGCKLMSITCGDSIRFIDSLNFLQMPLAQLPKAFKFEGEKGYFPHFFNINANKNYIGPLPPLEYYGYDTMKQSMRIEFLKWYNEQTEREYIFNMSVEIVKYCKSDVDILRRACIKFRECFVETNNVDPLLESITIASACNLVFRRNFLKPETIGIMPSGGYRKCDKQSKVAAIWLEWIARKNNIKINHAGNGREMKLKENILVDGFCIASNTVYEFYGCYWHGCNRCFPNQKAPLYDINNKEEENNVTETMADRRESTFFKETRIRSAGYNLVTIWECDFKRQISKNVELKHFVETRNVVEDIPLNPRDSFCGGRTNACKLYYKCRQGEKIRYLDVCSLYPYVNKYSKYPLGHPKNIYVGHEECLSANINEIDGLIKCIILPPQNLYHPVLPYKCNGKLTFPLCRVCVETANQNECNHNNEERSFTGTFVADELRKALEQGYTVIEFKEIWVYKTTKYNRETKCGGLFSDYVNTFLKIKQECSGWPSWCQTDDDKEKYIAEYREKEGINLNKDKVCKNPGLRFLAKIMLNSFWGKFGQRPNLQKTKVVFEPKDLYEILSNPSFVVNSITIVNPEVLLVTYERTDEDVLPHPTVSVPIAAYTTSAARLELYKYLDQLGGRVLYFDTDSVFFTQKDDEWIPPTGDFLGDLTDEMTEYGTESYICEFVSAGPKNYSFKFWNNNTKEYNTVCKVKGITLHYKNSEKVNFDVMKTMICDDNETIVTLTDRTIVRNARYDVLTQVRSKKYRVNYTKRRRLNNNSYDTLPYGYRK